MAARGARAAAGKAANHGPSKTYSTSLLGISMGIVTPHLSGMETWRMA